MWMVYCKECQAVLGDSKPLQYIGTKCPNCDIRLTWPLIQVGEEK